MNIKNIVSTIILVLLVVSGMRLFGLSIPFQVVTTAASGELSIVGEGKVDVVPDTAYVDVGIAVNRVATAKDAQKQIDEINNRIIVSLAGLGIAKKDIKTSNYSINPSYNYSNNKEVLDGYNGNVTVSIKTRKTDLLSQIISASTEAGANQVQGTRFEVGNPAQYREAARKKAIENAKDQARKVAADLGIRLGNVTNIVEVSTDGVINPGPVMYALDKRSMGGGGGPSIEPGSQTISSMVTLYFAKK